MTTTQATALDLDHLLKARLVVARFGEMDVATWWNTKGVLGRSGSTLYGRGLPRTHRFAQARVVFEIATVRSGEVYQLPDATTLWNLPAEVEDAFHERWHHWLTEQERWLPLFTLLETIAGGDLLDHLASVGVLTKEIRDQVAPLRRTADGRAVPITGIESIDDHAISLLAAGFAKGEPGRLAVPFLKVDAV